MPVIKHMRLRVKFLIGAIVVFAFLSGGIIGELRAPPSTPDYCRVGEVFIPSEFGLVLVGNQLVCFGPMTGPAKVH